MGHGQERTQVQKEATRTGRLGDRIQGSKARSGKLRTVSHRCVTLPKAEYHLPSLLRTNSAAPDLGTIRGGGWVPPGQ